MRGQVCPSRLEFDLQATWAAPLSPTRMYFQRNIYLLKKNKKNINFHFFWLVTVFYGVGDVTAQEAVELMLMSVSIKSHGVL